MLKVFKATTDILEGLPGPAVLLSKGAIGLALMHGPRALGWGGLGKRACERALGRVAE
jgi:hypothetical protein